MSKHPKQTLSESREAVYIKRKFYEFLNDNNFVMAVIDANTIAIYDSTDSGATVVIPNDQDIAG